MGGNEKEKEEVGRGGGARGGRGGFRPFVHVCLTFIWSSQSCLRFGLVRMSSELRWISQKSASVVFSLARY